ISVGALVLYGHDDDDASVKDMSIDKFSVSSWEIVVEGCICQDLSWKEVVVTMCVIFINTDMSRLSDGPGYSLWAKK
ncbi:hypothetical protein Tco_0934326, partial [Tanacetum coccineum]